MKIKKTLLFTLTSTRGSFGEFRRCLIVFDFDKFFVIVCKINIFVISKYILCNCDWLFIAFIPFKCKIEFDQIENVRNSKDAILFNIIQRHMWLGLEKKNTSYLAHSFKLTLKDVNKQFLFIRFIACISNFYANNLTFF